MIYRTRSHSKNAGVLLSSIEIQRSGRNINPCPSVSMFVEGGHVGDMLGVKWDLNCALLPHPLRRA